MIHHISINVSNIAAGKEFYAKALAPLGYTLMSDYPEWSLAGFGEAGKADTWIHAPGAPVTTKTHIAYSAPSREAVQAFYDAGLAAGGKDNGAPGIRENYAPNYYAAFLLDPDGNNVEVVCMDPRVASAA